MQVLLNTPQELLEHTNLQDFFAKEWKSGIDVMIIEMYPPFLKFYFVYHCSTAFPSKG